MASKPFPSNHELSSADVNDLVGILDRSTAEFDLVNSAAATALWSKTVAAAAMSTDRMLRGTIIGDYLNNTGGAASLAISLQLGGVAVLADTMTAIDAGATRRPWRFVFEIANLNSASAQFAAGLFSFGAATAATAGTGDVFADNYVSSLNATTQQNAILAGAATGATGSAIAVAFAAAHGSASASLSFRKKYACLELL